MSFFLPFRGLSSKKMIPVWDGDPAHLPEIGKKFLYNGEKFSWRPCNCKPTCQRPNVYNSRGELDKEMTILARGKDQGYIVLDVLIKAGHTPVELSKLGPDDYGELVLAFSKEARASESPVAYAASRGISPSDMVGALIESRNIRLANLTIRSR